MQLEVLRAPSARRRARRPATCSRRACGVSMSRGIDRRPNSARRALGRRQQAGQHLHRRRLAAAVRAEEAEDLAALDAKADVVDGGEVAEAAGQVLRLDGRRAVVTAAAGGIDAASRCLRALVLRQQRDEGLFERAPAGLRLQFGRRARGQDRGRRPSRPASRSAPPPPCRRWRRARSCPAGGARMPSISSQNWRRDSGSTPVVGSSRMSRSGSWISAQHSAELLLHAAGELAGRPVGEGREAGAAQQFVDAPRALVGALAEQAAEEVDVLDAPTASDRGSCPSPAACRRCAAARARRRRVGHVAAEHRDACRLDAAHARRRAPAASTCRRRPARSGRPCSPAGISTVTSSSAAPAP